MSRYHLDAYSAVERGRDELSSFLRSTFRFVDPRLNEAVHRQIDAFGLLAPCVVEATYPYDEPRAGPRTTAELAAAGILHPELVALLANAKDGAGWPETRKLYTHQVVALEEYRRGSSLVVASGTGSGKTECFLLPAIDTVLRDPELARPGVRVLIVYPLNALVNNQMDRLRAILGHHPKIRFALYTRRLAETEKQAVRRLDNAGEARLPAEIISREELRARPPHILVTNFSMLEYALVRPPDAGLFSESVAKPRLAVLDEAHVYSGSMAAEITLLLRRAWLRWGIDPHGVQGIVTSATMHQGVADGPVALRAFAANVLSKPTDAVHAIEGKRALEHAEGAEVDTALPPPDAVASMSTDFRTLDATASPDSGVDHVFHDSPDARAGVSKILASLRPHFAGEADAPPARRLWLALSPLAWVRRLCAGLHAERLTVDQVATLLFANEGSEHSRRRAAHKLLEVLAVARPSPSGLPLLPVRLHAIMRGPHGVFACIDGGCPRAAVAGRIGALYSDPVDRCACGALVCELRVCEGCGQSFLLAERGMNDDHVPTLIGVAPEGPELFVPGAIWDDGTVFDAHEVEHVLADGRLVDGAGLPFAAFPGGKLAGATRQLVGVACPRCETKRAQGSTVRRVESGTDAAIQVIVDALYSRLPEHPNADRESLPGRGRRALLFADNRQIAASLAAKIEESHDILLARAVLIDSLNRASEDAASPRIEGLERQIRAARRSGDKATQSRLEDELAAEEAGARDASVPFSRLVTAVADHASLREVSNWKPDATDDLAKLLIARELGRRPARGGNVEASGLALIDYVVAAPLACDPDVARAFAGDAWPDLLLTLLDTLRTSGVVTLPAITSSYFELLNRHRYGKSVTFAGSPLEEEDDIQDTWEPAQIAFAPTAPRSSRRLEYVHRVLARVKAPARVTAFVVLREAWGALLAAARVDGSSLKRTEDRLTLPLSLLRFRVGPRTTRWHCARCRTVWLREVALVCPTRECNGTLAPLATGQRAPDDRLTEVALDRERYPLLGMKTEEHTAQIGVLQLVDVERDFKAGRKNLLVSSTTMELGIDIGGLSATILTNVPPGPSNYLQRAGRAGRRSEGTSLVLTFARPRPFDQAVFQAPDKPFRDRIVPPSVTLDSPRIVQRHANAFLLASFFLRYGAHAQARDPMRALRTIDEFFSRTLSDVFPGNASTLFAGLGVSPSACTLAEAFLEWLLVVGDESPISAALRALLHNTVLADKSVSRVTRRAADRLQEIRDDVLAQLRSIRSDRNEETARPVGERDAGAIDALDLQERELLDERILAYLAEGQFLPRYSFPVQVVALAHTHEQKRDGAGRVVSEDPDNRLRLSRDLSLALSDYAPGAEVVAGKYIHESRGLLRHWTGVDAPGVLAKRFLGICACGQLQYARNNVELKVPCPTCGADQVRTLQVIEPRSGFAVQWGKRPRRWSGATPAPLRPVTEASYAARSGETAVRVSECLSLAYDEEGQILVRTEGELAPLPDPQSGARPPGGARAGYGYAICYVCGRAEPETHHAPGPKRKGQADSLPPRLKNHRRLRGSQRCTSNGQYWRHIALAGAMRTETLRFQLRGQAEPTAQNARRFGMTWLVALRLSAGDVLGIDSRSLGGLLEPRPSTAGVAYDAVLYDQVAGGAGYSRALQERWPELINAVRGRLACENFQCVHGCHRCLIAYETQRYENEMCRTELAAFLADKWGLIESTPLRDGVPVSPVYRGASELRDQLSRAKTARVIAVAETIAADAMDDHGWLRALLRHADQGGRIDLVLGERPGRDGDAARVVLERLRHAVTDGRFALTVADARSVAACGWRIVLPETPAAFYAEKGTPDRSLAPDWLDGGLSRAGAPAASAVIDRVESILRTGNRLKREDLTLPPPPPSTILLHVPEGAPSSEATFERWLVNSSGDSLFARPLQSLLIIDPYLATEWQLHLLGEIVTLARKAQCRTLRVETYPPDFDKEGTGRGAHRTVTASEQRVKIAGLTGEPSWSPLPDPGRGKKRHSRLLKGVRTAGASFEVVLERGIDFITFRLTRGASERATRETYITVRDPA